MKQVKKLQQKKAQQNSGFTLIEVIVSVVVVSILFIGLIFAFNAIWKVNGLSSQKDQASNITTTIVEELSSTSYADIDNDYKFIFPSQLDTTNTVYTITEGVNKKTIKIENISGRVYSYNAIIDIIPNEDSDINKVKFADVTYLDDTTNCIISLNNEINEFKKDSDDNYERNADGSYVRYKDYFYDELALQGFLNKHLQYINTIYSDACDNVMRNNLISETKLPLPKLEDYYSDITEENYIDYLKDIVKRNIYIDVVNHKTYVDVTVRLEYQVDDIKSQELVNSLHSQGKLSNSINSLLGSYSNVEELYVMRNATYYDMKNMIIEYIPTICYNENIYFENNTESLAYGDKEFNLYFYVTDKFKNNAAVNYPTIDLNSFIFKQDLANKKVDVYTNSPTIKTYLDSSGYVKNVTLSSNKDADTDVRMYDVQIEINNVNGDQVFSTVQSNVLY